jgi:hypothetical protein
MAWLALFGWIVLSGFGLYLVAGGLFLAYVEAAFGGRPGPLGFIFAAVGVALLVLAAHVSPIHIAWSIRP